MTEFRPSRFETLPLVIKNLVIINVLVFLAQTALRSGGLIDIEDLFALHNLKSPLFQPWQLLTHLFLHGSFWHLFSNMLGLWMFGSVLENLWGPRKFLTFYFVCGLGAGLLQLVFLMHDIQPVLNQCAEVQLHPSADAINAFYNRFEAGPHTKAVIEQYGRDLGNPEAIRAFSRDIKEIKDMYLNNPTLGASGAVFGVLAAFVYLFPNVYLYFYFFIPVKAKWAGLAYFAFEVYSGVVNHPGDNIAHWAHIGGGLVGFLLVLTWNNKNRRNFY